jgi:hypothetical protein
MESLTGEEKICSGKEFLEVELDLISPVFQTLACTGLGFTLKSFLVPEQAAREPLKLSADECFHELTAL